MSDSPSNANTIVRILLIVGGVILFILLAIFILRLVPKVISSIANVGSSIRSSFSNTINTDEEIAVTTNIESVEAGSPVIVSFEYTPTAPGQYFVSYTCFDGLFYDIQSSNGPKRIICNTPFRLGENISSISLVPVVTKSNIFIDSTLKVEYRDSSNNPIATGTKLITIKNENGTNVSATSTAENPFTANEPLSGSTVTTTPVTPSTPVKIKPPTQTTKPYVPVVQTRDLAITQIYGIDNKSAFVFHVYNYGNTTVGPWEFSYTDAENPSKTILSPLQAQLGPGQGLAITVNFDGQKNPNQVIVVQLDPYNKIVETSKLNNTASVIITGSTSGHDSPQGLADLAITTFEAGRMSGSRFIAGSRISEDDTAAVRFIAKNQGGKPTDTWKVELTDLPYTKNDTYKSKLYQSLLPGQSLEIIVEFEGIDKGVYSIRLEVDSDDDVDEENERNNTKTISLEVTR